MEKSFDVYIISTREDNQQTINNVTVDSFNGNSFSYKKTISTVVEKLSHISPDVIICDYPIAVIAAKHYTRSKKVPIIYEVTEWYPSKKNLTNKNIIIKTIKSILLIVINLYSGLLCDQFIFGEYYKSLPFKIFFWKRKYHIPYYFDAEYLTTYPVNQFIDKEINCLYSGLINKNKGIENIIKAINYAASIKNETIFKLTIIGKFETDVDRIEFEKLTKNPHKNFSFVLINNLSFTEYCKIIGNYDIYFDLREKDVENNHCLPIKLFLYTACERPVIYSNLKSIQKEIKDHTAGYFCAPDNKKDIAMRLIYYINNKESYFEHCRLAKAIYKEKYCWETIKNNLLEAVNYTDTDSSA
ncbi:MAG: glycosyltransferase [Paludibacteraceae bacterium]